MTRFAQTLISRSARVKPRALGADMRHSDLTARRDRANNRTAKALLYDATRSSDNLPQIECWFSQLHMPVMNRPFAVLFEQQCSHELHSGIFVGEDANNVAPPLDLGMRRSRSDEWIFAVDLSGSS
jgi:hypothetical protein